MCVWVELDGLAHMIHRERKCVRVRERKREIVRACV